MDLITSTEDVFTTPSGHSQTTQADQTDLFQETLTGPFKDFIVTSGVIINLFGLLSSAIIFVVMYKDKSLRKPYNALIGSMTVSDMVGCGVLNLIQVAGIHYEKFPITWPSADVMAKIHIILCFQQVLSVILHVIVISIMRYMMVLHPAISTRIINKFSVGLLILITHILSCIIVSNKFTNQLTFIKALGLSVDLGNNNVFVIMMGTPLALSAVVIVYCYIRIHRVVYLAKHKIQTVIMERNTRKEAKRALKTNSSHRYILLCIVTILGLLIIGHFPVLFVLSSMLSGESFSMYTLTMTEMILWISHALHSLVYAVLDPNFRKGFKSVMTSNSLTVNPSETIGLTLNRLTVSPSESIELPPNKARVNPNETIELPPNRARVNPNETIELTSNRVTANPSESIEITSNRVTGNPSKTIKLTPNRATANPSETIELTPNRVTVNPSETIGTTPNRVTANPNVISSK